MFRIIAVSVIAMPLLFAVSSVSKACSFNCEKANNGTNVKIPSGSGLEGYQDIISGKQPKPFTITGKLFVPGECDAAKKLPAVIIQHGSGMPSGDWYTKLPEALNKSGIVALVPDSHSARGITGTGKNQAQLSKADRLYDTFSAFNFLETVPCVDTARVGVTGYSFGGIIAMDSVETVLANKLANGKSYKASMPVYPSCQATFKNTSSTKTKVHVLVGELDDYTPAKYCFDAVKFKKQRGWNIDLTVLEGAHHGFIRTSGPKSSQSWTFGGCGPIEIDEEGYETSKEYGFSSRDGWKNLIKKAVKTCAKRGVTVGGSNKTAKATLEYTVKFFSENL
ncbi:MAG: dienelactone hydrolase family protein [Alphaproteobacteria bacterium]